MPFSTPATAQRVSSRAPGSRSIQLSSGGAHGVWHGHNLLAEHDLLLRMEKAPAERKIELKEDQIGLIEHFGDC